MSIANEMIERTRQTLREQSNEPVECAQCGLEAEPDWKGFARVKVRSNREPEVFCGRCTGILSERFAELMQRQADELENLQASYQRKRDAVLERYEFDTFDFEDLEFDKGCAVCEGDGWLSPETGEVCECGLPALCVGCEAKPATLACAGEHGDYVGPEYCSLCRLCEECFDDYEPKGA